MLLPLHCLIVSICLIEISVDDQLYERREIGPNTPPEHPNARRLYNYWLEKRGQRAFPSWRDIDLLDLWQIASCLIVKDVIDYGADFRNRYWGTQVTQRAGFDATGRTHSEIYKNQPLGPQMDTYQAVINTRRPYMVHRTSTFIEGREFVVFNALNLPLGTSDEKVDHIMIAIDYE